MIKFENTEVMGWEAAIRGMRNPMNSWGKSDSEYTKECSTCKYYDEEDEVCRADDWSGQPMNTENCYEFEIGPNDLDLMKRLRNAGTDHRKFMRMITVYVDITAPLYWWKEFDTYKVGTVANSCSTMHKIHAKEFTLEDFSTEHLYSGELEFFKEIIDCLNGYRDLYLDSKKNESPRVVKNDWWQMVQLLPSSYNQKRTVMMNYEVLANIYKSRRNHKLDEWAEHDNIDTKTLKRFYDGDFKLRDQKSLNDIGFCDWIKTLPYSELITGPSLSDIPIANEIMEEAKRRVEE